MTTAGFDEQWTATAVAQLRDRGVEFASGMTDSDRAAIEARFECPIPPELSMFLRAGVPVSPKSARWTEGTDLVAVESRQWLRRDLRLRHRAHRLLAPPPRTSPRRPLRRDRAELAIVAQAPTLFPICSHRFLVSLPAEGPRAVLSVWQAVDSIFYGNDLADYLATEFGIDRPDWAADEPPRVPVWEDLFDLFGEWNTDEAT